MDNATPKVIKFSDIKPTVVKALEEKIRNNKLHISESVTIVDGFVNQTLSTELSGSFVIGGPAVPMIMLIGDDSGRVYYFALKALLSDIEL